MQGFSSYKVLSRPRSGGDEKLIGMYMIYDHALTKAANAVMDDLQKLYQSGQSAKELYDLWCEKGTDISIEPDDGVPYNSANLARGLAPRVTLDYSLPLLFKVDCTDTLIMPSGASAPAKTWTFYLHAPAVYEGSVANEGDGVRGLILRATEILYEDMSVKSMHAEGSSYKLLDLKYHLLNEEEAKAASLNRNNIYYYVQEEGEFGNVPPKAALIDSSSSKS
ncbi:MAG: hypothetical protein KIT34_01835 [Cyanobacteria bacterium TGS_CYA1]|nr:hypothetical protein [Cyanobacteria bacterium TGS_CYA1]